jgi:hypothetical protein
MNPLAVIEIGAKLLDKIIPDKEAREKAQAELLRASQEQDFVLTLAQIQINQEEAKSSNWFVAGWRPFIGWTCGSAFAYHFVVQPLLIFLFAVSGYAVPELPSFDMASLLTVLGGLLGLGSLRTFEKFKGVARD